MILGRTEILKYLRKGKIKISPFDRANLGPASIDLTLDNSFRIFPKKNKIIIKNDTDFKKYSKIVKGPITLKPGEFALGITKERIELPENVCGLLTGRTRFARLGILVHATASLIQPGVNNKQVLEIKNISKNNTITISEGLKLCQLLFVKMKGKGKYLGWVKNQNSV